MSRRRFLGLGAALAGTALAGSGCTTTETVQRDPIRVGLILPKVGPYLPIGADELKGFTLYLKLNGNKVGGRPVQLFHADEGVTQESAAAAAKKLIDQDRVHVITGCISSLGIGGAAEVAPKSKVPLLGSCANSSATQGRDYVRSTGFINAHSGISLGRYVAAAHKSDKVFLIGPDYQAGHDYLNSFKTTFVPAGGKIAGTVYTPFPGTKDFRSAFDQVRNSDADAVYAFYAGADAVNFVQQYQKYGVADDYQLYAPGFMTEGSNTLKQEGSAATGLLNAMYYSPDLDSPANRSYVAAYQDEYDALPNAFSVSAHDAFAVLDRAVTAAGSDLSGPRLFDAIAAVGQVDSPRGAWTFGRNGVPVQKWYLRKVQRDGEVLSNVVVQDLGTLGD
ncbi:ABC transporter substrate-binding protein [Actinocatenispora rupis]|uniref:ABC transporter substrate-binding protein n=1 Tax=Actinocatenispora rupis TaxID=519421 RepID=A0A8J3NCF3_9ACTN|nr:ABC transporter substrate-binding protein [Actinocatenispora rupis]GID11707.1 ABC transporter substrate-binding protein [Actinocatenispora rupis]